MDYTTLVSDRETYGSIKSWINYSRLDSDIILDEAEAWIYAKLRVPDMRTVASVSIASGASTASFPTGYRSSIHFGIPGLITTIKLKDVEFFRSCLGWDEDAVLPEGPPTYWCRYDELIQLNYKADQAYTAKMAYYKTPTALSGSNTTNWLTEKYPTLLRKVCTLFAADERKEYETRDRCESEAMRIIQEIKVETEGDDMRGLEIDFHWTEND